MAREADWAQITLPSGEIRRIPAACRATIGAGRQRRPHEHRDRQGRPQSLDGQSAARPRHGDEPDRPSARRRRRPHQGRPASGQPDGQAGQGRRHPQASQAVELGDRSPSPVAALRSTEDCSNCSQSRALQLQCNRRSESNHGTFAEKRSVCRSQAVQEGASCACRRGSKEPIKTWARACTIVPEFVGQRSWSTTASMHMKVFVTEDMVGHELGEFAPDADLPRPRRQGRRRKRQAAAAAELPLIRAAAAIETQDDSNHGITKPHIASPGSAPARCGRWPT